MHFGHSSDPLHDSSGTVGNRRTRRRLTWLNAATLLLLLVLLLAPSPAAGQGLVTRFQRIAVGDGLSENTVLTIAQDRLQGNSSTARAYGKGIEGFDRDLGYAGTRRYSTDTQLHGGRYTLRARGSNRDSAWNEGGASVHIALWPPVGEWWGFIGGVVLALAGVAFALYCWRVQSIVARNRELAQQVHERTDEIERRRQVAEGLREMLAVLNTDQPLGDVLSYIVSQACRFTGSDAGVLYRFDFHNNLSFADATAGMPADFQELGSFPIPDSAPQRAVMDGRAYATPDLTPYLERAREESALWPAPLQSWLEIIGRRFCARLAVPLIIKGQTYGAIELYYRTPHAFSPEEIDLALSFSNQAALVIENARLRTQAKESAAAAERSRLARELHDAVSQTLFSASLIAEVLPRLWERKPEEGRRRLNELRELTRGALAEMRTLLLELRPAALAEAALPELLRQLGESVTGRARIPVIVGSEGACDLPPEVKVAFYRIAQEALNNVVKHARARSATIFLDCTADRVRLDIEDDGQGFDPTMATPEHLGLGIMHERADAIGAQLEIQSDLDEGTCVRVIWRP
jgi:signal transduction histidine kinase